MFASVSRAPLKPHLCTICRPFHYIKHCTHSYRTVILHHSVSGSDSTYLFIWFWSQQIPCIYRLCNGGVCHWHLLEVAITSLIDTIRLSPSPFDLVNSSLPGEWGWGGTPTCSALFIYIIIIALTLYTSDYLIEKSNNPVIALDQQLINRGLIGLIYWNYDSS